MQRKTDTAERDGNGWLGLGRQHRGEAKAGEPANEPAGADRVQHLDGGDVERLRQRLAHRDGAVEVLIEVLGGIGTKADRAVLDQRLGVGKTGLETKAIDQRLQGRAGRADRIRHVDGTEPGVIEVAGRTDMGEDFAGAVVGNQDRSGELVTERLSVIAGERFQAALQVALKRQADHGLARRAGALGFGEMRGKLGERAAESGHGLGLCAGEFGERDDMGGKSAREHPVTGAPRSYG